MINLVSLLYLSEDGVYNFIDSIHEKVNIVVV